MKKAIRPQRNEPRVLDIKMQLNKVVGGGLEGAIKPGPHHLGG